MNCEECLKQLSTLSIREIPTSAAWKHSATCSDCAQMIRVITETEAELAADLDATRSAIPSMYTARQAVGFGARRRTSMWVRVGVGALAVTIAGIALQREVFRDVVDASSAVPLETTTFAIKCLKNEQAIDLIRPYFKSRQSRIVLPSSSEFAILSVEAPHHEIEAAREVLAQFDVPPGEKCAVPSKDFPPPP